MSFIANHTWLVPLVLNLIVLALFVYTMINPGAGPDGAAEAAFMFIFVVIGTIVIWAMFGAYHLLMFFLNMWHG